MKILRSFALAIASLLSFTTASPILIGIDVLRGPQDQVVFLAKDKHIGADGLNPCEKELFEGIQGMIDKDMPLDIVWEKEQNSPFEYKNIGSISWGHKTLDGETVLNSCGYEKPPITKDDAIYELAKLITEYLEIKKPTNIIFHEADTRLRHITLPEYQKSLKHIAPLARGGMEIFAQKINAFTLPPEEDSTRKQLINMLWKEQFLSWYNNSQKFIDDNKQFLFDLNNQIQLLTFYRMTIIEHTLPNWNFLHLIINSDKPVLLYAGSGHIDEGYEGVHFGIKSLLTQHFGYSLVKSFNEEDFSRSPYSPLPPKLIENLFAEYIFNKPGLSSTAGRTSANQDTSEEFTRVLELKEKLCLEFEEKKQQLENSEYIVLRKKEIERFDALCQLFKTIHHHGFEYFLTRKACVIDFLKTISPDPRLNSLDIEIAALQAIIVKSMTTKQILELEQLLVMPNNVSGLLTTTTPPSSSGPIPSSSDKQPAQLVSELDGQDQETSPTAPTPLPSAGTKHAREDDDSDNHPAKRRRGNEK